ncbi:polyprenyl synthetase family protein [bacterium]|nr:polyprenyl synthetase family protein [bacterium]
MKLKEYFKKNLKLIDDYMDSVLPAESEEPQSLYSAMRYSLFAGGKRFRPILAMTVYKMFSEDYEKILPFCACVEMIHTYSLIHDDLPCMDDDDLRRGKPSNHIKFGESMALLAGDALLTHAFTVFLGESLNAGVDPEKIVRAGEIIGNKIGIMGMVIGQVFDLESERKPIDLKALEKIHRNKTGRLIETCINVPAVFTSIDNSRGVFLSLQRYSSLLGMIFQITDDILDVEGNTEELGKTVGRDEYLEKATYPRIIGIKKTKEILKSYVIDAKACLKDFPDNEYCDILEGIIDYLVERKK